MGSTAGESNLICDYINRPEIEIPEPLVKEGNSSPIGVERRMTGRHTTNKPITRFEFDETSGEVKEIKENIQVPTDKVQEGILCRITKTLHDKTSNIAVFTMDALPVFRKYAREILEKGWMITIRNSPSDRSGKPLYPWDGLSESEDIAQDGRVIVMTRMPKNMKATRFIKPRNPQDIVDAANATETKDQLGFGPKFSDTSHISIATCEVNKETGPEGKWYKEVLVPNCEYSCNPLEQVKQYGTGLFDGIGVEKNEDGEVIIFRLKEHWERMSQGGQYLKMPPIPYPTFEKMVIETIQANWAYIPEAGKGRLYIRPDWFDHGPQLKVNNSGQYVLLMLAVPIGSAESYFKKGRKKFFMAKGRARVAEGGNVGWIKMDGSYGTTVDLIHKAEAKGMAGVIFTNAAGDRVEETNASSVIFIQRNADGKHRIITPKLEHGTILDSVTRKTILTLAQENGWIVEERDISPKELAEMAKNGNMEAIAVGTAAAVAPIHEIQVGSVDKHTNEINSDGALIQISEKGEEGRGPVSQMIFEEIMAVKSRKAQKEMRKELEALMKDGSNPEKAADLQRKLQEQEGWLTIVPKP